MNPKNVFHQLPSIDEVKRICQSVAMLDAVLMPEWQFRYYSYNAHWGKRQGGMTEAMASMRDGEGGAYFILFDEIGAILKGYARHSTFADYIDRYQTPWPGVISEIPSEFSYFVNEPAFDIQFTTFCAWRKRTDSSWQTGNIVFPKSNYVDGAEDLLEILTGDAKTYKDWAESYYERDVSLDIVTRFYQSEILTVNMVLELNPEISIDKLRKDAAEIAYPCGL